MGEDYIPDLLFLELTKACDYKCLHCRASSITEIAPDEMKGFEFKQLLESIPTSMDRVPHLIFTGGNPLMHPDFSGIMQKASELKMSFSVSPSAGDFLTVDQIFLMEELGLSSISLSIDGIPSTHDYIRNRKGSFKKTVELASMLKSEGVNTQVNTTIMKRNILDLPFLYHTIREMDIQVWELFFLIKTGRGVSEEPVSSAEMEDILKYLYMLKIAGCKIRTVEAPEISRIEVEAIRNGFIEGGPLLKELVKETRKLTGIDLHGIDIPDHYNARRRTKTLFVSSTGEVSVSGLFNLSIGNVRERSLGEIIRTSQVLKDISDPRKLKGKCGTCEYNGICGGSRGRAYVEEGDFLESDPACIYPQEKVYSKI
ncbi:MAG: radical SAM protein [Candidatus Thermoplasmatota archaeon]|nr:radical SAM protein [Candidatus Thermoplasmatota archaeon]